MRQTAAQPVSSDFPHFFDRHDGHGLNAEHLCGETCIICGAADGPMEPAGFGPRGQLFRHPSCAGDRLEAPGP
jgi:hypothetical protein